MTIQYVGYSDEISSLNGKTTGSRSVYYMSPDFVDEKKHKRSKSSKMLALVPFADSFAAACEGEKVLSTMAGKFGSRLTSWGGAYAAYALSRGISNTVCKHSDSAKDIRDHHPLISFIAEFGLFLGTLKAGQTAIAKVLPKIPQGYKEQVKEGFAMMKQALDSSKLNEKVFKPAVNKVTETLNANPEVKNIAKKGLKYLAPALIVLSMFDACFVEPVRKEKQTRKMEEALERELLNSFFVK